MLSPLRLVHYTYMRNAINGFDIIKIANICCAIASLLNLSTYTGDRHARNRASHGRSRTGILPQNFLNSSSKLTHRRTLADFLALDEEAWNFHNW